MTVEVEDVAQADVGRPTEYHDDIPRQARLLCERGATDDELAEFFDVSTRTIYRWKHDHEEFCQAIKAGKEMADERVERSLYQMAVGRTVVEQQAIKVKLEQFKEEVQVVAVERFVDAQTPAAIFWLKNRRPDDWREKSEVKVTMNHEDALEQLE